MTGEELDDSAVRNPVDFARLGRTDETGGAFLFDRLRVEAEQRRGLVGRVIFFQRVEERDVLFHGNLFENVTADGFSVSGGTLLRAEHIARVDLAINGGEVA